MTKTKTLEEGMKDLIKSLQGEYTVKLTLSEQDSSDKLEWLKRDSRDFLQVNGAMSKAVSAVFVDSLVNSNLEEPETAVQQTLTDVGEAVLQHITKRFQGGKRDIRLKPLSKEYIKKKGHNRIGILSGDLFRDILNATVTVKKKESE